MKIEIDNIYNTNCLEGMKAMPDNSVDCVITSPPYDNLRTYNGYCFDFENIAKELFRVIKDGGVVVWVVGDATIKGSETGTSFRQALYFKEIGFNIHDTMIYAKNEVFAHDPRNKRYKQSFEYMFIFSKGTPKTYNEIKDKKVISAGKMIGGEKGRNRNGELRRKHSFIANDYQARFNIWSYDTGSNITHDKIAFEHPAIFPEKLVRDHIISWSNEGDLVFDPFMGSGTTAKVARALGRHCIGFEISSEYCEIIRQRLTDTKTMMDTIDIKVNV